MFAANFSGPEHGNEETFSDVSSLLTDDDRANGFSIRANDDHNITLLKWSKPVAWFSAAISGEVLKGFLELMKDCERSAKGGI